MVAANDGVTKLFPVAKADPPLALPNQLKVPVVAAAAKVTLPLPHRLAGVVDVIDGKAFTVAMTAVLAEVQLPFVAST